MPFLQHQSCVWWACIQAMVFALLIVFLEIIVQAASRWSSTLSAGTVIFHVFHTSLSSCVEYFVLSHYYRKFMGHLWFNFFACLDWMRCYRHLVKRFMSIALRQVSGLLQWAHETVSGWQWGQVFMRGLMTPSLYIVTEETGEECALWRKLQEELAPGFKLCRNKKKRACDQNKATKTTSNTHSVGPVFLQAALEIFLLVLTCWIL